MGYVTKCHLKATNIYTSTCTEYMHAAEEDWWQTKECYNIFFFFVYRHLAIRYQQLHGSSDSNAFWPGQLLDKLRLCMPPYDKPELPDQSGIVFQKVKERKLTNLGKARDYSAWPVNDQGYVQSGIYDPFARKFIHNYWW